MLKDCCDLLDQKKLKVAFIESASSGYLSSQFSIYKECGAQILLGGLVCYDADLKMSILGVPTELIDKYSPESPEVTNALAVTGHKLFKEADIIVACTGLLKPGGSESKEKPVGTFFISIFFEDQTYDYRYLINGTPEERLDKLTEQIADQMMELINRKAA